MIWRISPFSSVLSLTASNPTVVPLSGSVATSGTGRNGAVAGLYQKEGLNQLGWLGGGVVAGVGTGALSVSTAGGGVSDQPEDASTLSAPRDSTCMRLRRLSTMRRISRQL